MRWGHRGTCWCGTALFEWASPLPWASEPKPKTHASLLPWPQSCPPAPAAASCSLALQTPKHAQVADSLSRNSSITSVDLSGNAITEEGIKVRRRARSARHAYGVWGNRWRAHAVMRASRLDLMRASSRALQAVCHLPACLVLRLQRGMCLNE